MLDFAAAMAGPYELLSPLLKGVYIGDYYGGCEGIP